MTSLALALVLAASPRLACPGLSYVNLDQKTGEFYLDYFTQQLAARGIPVVTSTEMSALLGFDRQKQLMGCAESGCTAELAGALGADFLIIGSLAKINSGFVVNLKVVAARDASARAVFSSRLSGESELLDYLASSARSLAAQLTGRPELARATESPPPPRALAVGVETGPGAGRPSWVVSAGFAALLLAGAGVSYGLASSTYSGLTDGGLQASTYAQVVRARMSGQDEQALALAFVLAGAGTAALAGVQLALPTGWALRRWFPLFAPAAMVLAGVALYASAASDLSTLSTGNPALGDLAGVERFRGAGEMKATAGTGLIAAGLLGAACLATFELWPRRTAELSISPRDGGAMAALTGRF